jgi:transcriptional regulator with XRE-family HTH domain
MSAGAATDFTRRLGALLQQQRRKMALTQEELAERADLSLKYVGEVERGEANVTVLALERIAVALGWEPWSLFATRTPPISGRIHQLLMREIGAARDRLQTTFDWLLALDPSKRASDSSPIVEPSATATLLELLPDIETPAPSSPHRARPRKQIGGEP